MGDKEGAYFISFVIVKDPPKSLEYGFSDVVPWFGKSGLGDQVKSSKPLKELLDEGYIEIIERLEYKSGKWVNILDNTTSAVKADNVITKIKNTVNLPNCK